MLTITLQKWGNSFAMRIPKAVVESLRLDEGQELTLMETKDGEGFVVARISPNERPLNRLLRQVTPENIHTETDWGPSQGNEVW